MQISNFEYETVGFRPWEPGKKGIRDTLAKML
jgi:hypothetical protein